MNAVLQGRSSQRRFHPEFPSLGLSQTVVHASIEFGADHAVLR